MPVMAPVRPSPKRMLKVLPGPEQSASFFAKAPLEGLGRNSSDRLFAAEEGGVEPTEGPNSTLSATGQLLGDRFGLSENLTKGDDAEARANFLSRAPKYLDELPAPEGRTPTRAESARADDYVQMQVNQGQENEDRLQALRGFDEARIAGDLAMSQRLQRQAAEQAFFERTGLPYDEKLAAKLAEFDQQAAEDAGFKTEMAAMTAEERSMLDQLPPAPDPVAMGLPEESPEAKQMSIVKSQVDKQRAAIKAHYDNQRRERLLLMAIRAGAAVGGAFNPQKPTVGQIGQVFDPGAGGPQTP